MLRRLTLAQKIAAALACLAVIPLALVSYRLVRLNRAAMTEQILRTHAVAARTASDRVEAFVDERRALAEAVAASPEVEADPRSPISRDLLVALLRSRSDLDVLAVVASDGEEYLRARRPDGDPDAEGVVELPGSDAVLLHSVADELYLRVVAEMSGGRGSVRAVFAAGTLEQVLDPDEIGEQAQMVLASRAGAVLVGSVSDLTSYPRVLVEQAQSGRLSGAQRYVSDGADAVLAAHAPVRGTPWYVASRQPGSVAEALGRATLRQSVAAVGLALVLAGAIFGAAYHSVVRPVRSLVQAQRDLAGIRDTQPIGDEIRDLESSFTALERRIQDQEAAGTAFLGRYRILGGLGAGMMGTVYRAWDPKLQRQLALKTVRLGNLSDAWGVNRLAWNLRNEAVTVAQFSHPNIVAIYDLDEMEDVAFIAMEIVDGVDLQTFLKKGKLTPGDTVLIGAAIARALAAAHERGIVHHDVKPGNVLLGRDGAIKVSDFGISELVSAEDEERTMIFGTPGYLAPESIRGDGYDERSDLFALGVLMYRCLAGARPFQGTNVEATIVSTMQHEPVPLWQIDGDIPRELSHLVMSMVARDPSERPATAHVVALELEAIAKDLGFEWEPPNEEMHEQNTGSDGDVPHVRLLPTEPVDTGRGG